MERTYRPPQRILDAELADVERVLDSIMAPKALASLTFLGGAGINTTLLVETTDNDRFVVKCAHGSEGYRALRRELTVMEFVANNTTVPVPMTIDTNLESRTDYPYMLLEWIEGKTLEETQDALPPHAHPHLFLALGETLAALHEDTRTSFGQHDIDLGSVNLAPAEDWPSVLESRLNEYGRFLADTRFAPLVSDVERALQVHHDELVTDEEPSLLHGDIGGDNVVFFGTSVASVLDWERALLGRPEFDLCIAEARLFTTNWGRKSRSQAMLHRGYRNRRELAPGFNRRRRLYLAILLLLPLTRFPEWAPDHATDRDRLAERIGRNLRDLLEPV